VWLSADEQRVWRNYLTMTARLQSAMSRQLQADCGLSLADYDVLVALDGRAREEQLGQRAREEQLGQERGCRIAELGERLGWEQSRLSHQLSRMRARGLVERTGAKDDRRAATVDLTADGRAALTSAAPGHAELVRALVFDGAGDNLCTVKDYGNFEMYVDWKIEPGGDSGIYLRGSPQVQIWDPVPDSPAAVGSGGLYNNKQHLSTPTVKADRPIGQWNTFHITVKGDEVTVKRLQRRGREVWLVAENPAFAPIVVDPKRTVLAIEGIGVGIVRRNNGW